MNKYYLVNYYNPQLEKSEVVIGASSETAALARLHELVPGSTVVDGPKELTVAEEIGND